MVALVPAQISKLCPRLHDAARRRFLPLPTTHHSLPTLLLSPLCFHTPLPRSARVQIHFPATPFFSHPYKTPGSVGSRTQSSPRLSLCALCLCGKSIFFKSLRPLCRLFSRFSALVSFVFNGLQPLFPKHPGGVPQLFPTTFGFRLEADSMHRSLEASLRSGEAWDKLKWMKKTHSAGGVVTNNEGKVLVVTTPPALCVFFIHFSL